MVNKSIFFVLIFSFLNILYAGCGGCSPKRSHSNPYSANAKGLIETVPDNKFIKGNVMVSCGMCNFMTNDNDCAMAIKVGKGVYSVSGVGIDEHGDSHAKDGYCNVIKKVYVEGRVSGNRFVPMKMDTSTL